MGGGPAHHRRPRGGRRRGPGRAAVRTPGRRPVPRRLAVTTWLHRIVVNACLDRIRRRQAHPTVPAAGRQPLRRRPSTGPEPAAPARTTTPRWSCAQALAALPAEQRAALVLVDVQGYPVAEAAEILGVAEGTIKSRCARGRARMAVALGHLRRGDDGHSGRTGTRRRTPGPSHPGRLPTRRPAATTRGEGRR